MVYVICVLITILWLYQFFIKKNYFSALTYIWAGIFVPLFMYQLGWSSLIDNSNSGMFNYIFICLAVTIAIYMLKTNGIKPNPIHTNEKIIITSTGKKLLPLLNFGFVILYFLENYMGSGSIIPGLQKIDIHAYTAPIISYITSMPFLVMAADYYAYKATKKKKYWLWILVVFIIPIITRSARLQMMISALQFLSLLLFLEGSKAMESLRSRKNYQKIKRVIIIGGIGLLIGVIQFTNYRMNHYGVYNLSYAELIGYEGPKNFSFLAPYYGYFPLSFNNLKINILYRTVEHNYIGLYSFACLFFGVFQIDNLFGIDTQGSIVNRLITHSAATVPTGFWDFYYDYGFFCFIPITVAMLVCYYFLKRAKREKTKLVYRTLYFWYIPLWFFMSFQNLIFASTIIVSGILIEIIVRRCFYVGVFQGG